MIPYLPRFGQRKERVSVQVPKNRKLPDKEKKRGIVKNVLDIWEECYKKGQQYTSQKGISD
jgi:hypothetical protein